jgi:ribonuclease D
MIAEADSKGLMPFVMEEQEALSTTVHKMEVKDFFLKQGDLRTLSPYDQYVLNALFVYRDELAQQINKPAFQVFDESLLRDFASGKLSPESIIEAKGVYRGYKNPQFAATLATRLNDIHAKAESLGLSHAPPPRTRLTSAEQADKRTADQDKTNKFAPIQQVLTDRYGINASRFILSNGTVNNLLNRTTSISALKRHYKQELIRTIAKELHIDISGYE